MDPPDSGLGGPRGGSNVTSAHQSTPFNGVRAWGGCPTLPTLQTPHIPSAIVLYFECTMVLYSVNDTRVEVENREDNVENKAVMTIEQRKEGASYCER